jgi:hypothetical protein
VIIIQLTLPTGASEAMRWDPGHLVTRWGVVVCKGDPRQLRGFSMEGLGFGDSIHQHQEHRAGWGRGELNFGCV